jgi:uncharacterized PurR-regulated membrane protein YhhQ (DUF165 family)|tara:strand:- start:160 stop:402 length:243 start_codon:yes stop_codon:yes gene_type:complete
MSIIKRQDIAISVVALSLFSAILFVGWGAVKGLLFDSTVQMSSEQYGAIFTFVFGILIGSALTYLGIRAGQNGSTTISQS